jgi:hypothetical protein
VAPAGRHFDELFSLYSRLAANDLTRAAA